MKEEIGFVVARVAESCFCALELIRISFRLVMSAFSVESQVLKEKPVVCVQYVLNCSSLSSAASHPLLPHPPTFLCKLTEAICPHCESKISGAHLNATT